MAVVTLETAAGFSEASENGSSYCSTLTDAEVTEGGDDSMEWEAEGHKS